jgi:hypothetical protein
MADRVSAALQRVQAMSAAELKGEWTRLFREPAPAVGPDLLARSIGYRLQERAHGGLSTVDRRRIERLVRQLEQYGEVSAEREVVLKSGTRLARDWGGKTHHVLVLDEGFLFEERRYTSLSSIAADITGSRWSGPRFFGLKRREKAFASVNVERADG